MACVIDVHVSITFTSVYHKSALINSVWKTNEHLYEGGGGNKSRPYKNSNNNDNYDNRSYLNGVKYIFNKQIVENGLVCATPYFRAFEQSIKRDPPHVFPYGIKKYIVYTKSLTWVRRRSWYPSTAWWRKFCTVYVNNVFFGHWVKFI
jgi:hypothetical protein